MKNAHSLTALKTCATVLFCAFFAFCTSLSAQSGTSKNTQQIKEFRAHCTEMLGDLPNASNIQASPALSATEKQQLLSAIKTFEEGGQIKDNASDATFSSLKKKVEGVENWLLTFQPSGAHSAAKANDSPDSNSPLEQCLRACRDHQAAAESDCTGKSKREKGLCRARALTTWMSCTFDCYIQ